MKERVTLTIESDIIKQIDNSVDGYNVKNRSHAVELLLLRALGTNTVKKGLILAGGKGTRFKPITDEIPKPMIPLQGKPIIQHTIDLMKKFGIRDIYISLGYKAEKFKEYFGDGSKFGVKITYLEEDEPLGTAGPLKLAKQYLTETFVMCNADELKDIDLIDMYLFHKENNAKATIALTTVNDPSAYGVAKMQGNKILEFIEKPKDPPSNLINAGLYILEPEVIDMVGEGFCMIEKEIFPKIAEEKRLFGYHFTGQWYDTGNLERYAKALKEWKGLKK
ncbi:nucleotidyltransferase family protein [Candidatus Woesearchaeota archaeon]|nr:MAG: nucleotidyltransferase family protein [Candidatus Woesearchaeota archaeon]